MNIGKEREEIPFEDKFYSVSELSEFIHVPVDTILKFVEEEKVLKEHLVEKDGIVYVSPTIALCIIYKALEEVKIQNSELEKRNQILQIMNEKTFIKLNELLSRVEEIEKIIEYKIDEAEKMMRKVRDAFNISESAQKIIDIEYYNDPISWN